MTSHGEAHSWIMAPNYFSRVPHDRLFADLPMGPGSPGRARHQPGLGRVPAGGPRQGPPPSYRLLSSARFFRSQQPA